MALVTATTLSAQSVRLAGPRVSSAAASPRVLPGTQAANAFGTIQGNALSSTNIAMPNALVRLRNARLGTIVDMQLTDKSGLFIFRSVEPGNYVAEMMAADETKVLAASQLITVSAGSAVSAVVRLPFGLPPLAGLLGASAPSASAVTASAAASGVMAATVSGAATCAVVDGPR